MRKKLIAGNWKMNLRRTSAVALAEAIARHPVDAVDLVVCPTFVHLEAVAACAP